MVHMMQRAVSGMVLLGGAVGIHLRSAAPATYNATYNPFPTPLPPSQDDIFMHYMKDHNLVVCGCGKCGTSSMYEYLYEKTFGHEWAYKWEPFIQDVESERWENNFVHITDESEQEKIMDTAFSYALIRDPKERLVSSWKSKLACGWEYGTDYDSKAFVRNLRALQGLPRNDSMTCMSLEDFAETLYDLHQKGIMRQLDRHFLPQNYGCFDRFRPHRWSQLSVIEEPESFKPLATSVGAMYTEPPHEHGSPSTIFVNGRVDYILDKVTRQEYEILAPYLPTRGTRVHAGLNVLEGRRHISLAA